MPICPNCKKAQRSRAKGRCPGCGAKVLIYEGFWYLEENGTPNVALMAHFYKRLSQRHSEGRKLPLNLAPPAKGRRYARELVLAKRLLERADLDYELAMAAIDLLFDHPRFAWKNRDNFLWIEWEYVITLEFARSIREEQELKKEKERNTLERAMKREDIFSS